MYVPIAPVDDALISCPEMASPRLTDFASIIYITLHVKKKERVWRLMHNCYSIESIQSEKNLDY